MIEPPGIPKDSRGTDGRKTLHIAPDGETPWSPGHPLNKKGQRPNKTWRFTVYGGLFEVESVTRALESAFGADDGHRERTTGTTALFAFTVDHTGYLVEGSATLSSCAWALGRLVGSRSVPRNWLDGFAAEERAFTRAFNQLAPQPEDGMSATRLGNAARCIGEHTRSAAVEAVGAGAKATGAAVTSAAAAAVTLAAGPVVGGIAGTVAGTFVEKLLTPAKTKNSADAAGDAGRPRTGQPAVQLPGFVLSASALHELVAEMAEALGVADILSPRRVRVDCVSVPARITENATEPAFLNSFIAEDLGTVARAAARGDIGAGLTRYLADSDALSGPHRVDVRKQEQVVLDAVAPDRQPLGRWPGDIAKPLVLSQQFAVNQIIAELGHGAGVFAVNGPPGTGKTTLLRDVIAAVVIARARTLAGLARPDDAFTGQVERVELNERYTTAVHGLLPAVTGSEMLVATNANAAAANVTAEIPGIGAVGDAGGHAVETDYFQELASQVLGAPAWGLLAATLGNRVNCAAFVKRFWWGDPAESPQVAQATGMSKILRQARDEPPPAEDWSAAVERFRVAEAEVRRLTAERTSTAAALRDRRGYARRVAEIEERLRQLALRASSLRTAVAAAEGEHAAARADLETATAAYREHRADRPGFWVSLSTGFRAGRDWDAEHTRRRVAYEQAATTCRDTRAGVDRLTTEYGAIDDEIRQQIAQREHTQNALSTITAALGEAQQRWPNCLPDPDVSRTDGDSLQLCTPWADPEFTEARNRVTLEALRVHKAFILGAAKQIHGNLSALPEVLTGNPDIGDEALRTAWQTLFLVVPVISTTFASLPRLFGRLGRESLGWLFIDEAGQASAQHAVGGLWRARRTVVVGDPQQIEPIVKLPLRAQNSLSGHYEVADEWRPSATSAQRVADRLNTYGTYLDDPVGDGSTWVGAPLRVHRRCDRLMFDIAHQIAYGGSLMVFGTPRRGPFAGRDRWIDVPTGPAEKNWVPAEGEALVDLLREITAVTDFRDVRVISPFREVADRAKRIARDTLGPKFVDGNVGTVHRVQGQEADVVIIVLGSASTAEKARQWAAAKPNLLNVAVSRARRRLYVIGDRSRWERQRHFDVLAAALPSGADGMEPT